MSAATIPRPDSVKEIKDKIVSQLGLAIRRWTRFEPQELVVAGVLPGEAKVTQVFRFDLKIVSATGSGKGKGRSATTVSNPEQLKRHIENDQAALRTRLGDRLLAWEKTQAKACSPIMTDASFVLAGSQGAHCDRGCDACVSKGYTTCRSCSGGGRLTCGACNGNGKILCTRCTGYRTIRRACYSCGGSGLRDNWHTVWERDHNGSTYSRQVNRPVTCGNCHGGIIWENCTCCDYTGYLNCMRCGASGAVSCSSCKATGRVGCPDCNATGLTHDWYVSEVAVTASNFVSAIDGDDLSETVVRLAGGKLNRYCSAWQSLSPKVEASAIQLYRILSIPYASASVGLHDDRLAVLAIGSSYEIRSFDGLGDKLLDNDVKELSDAMYSGDRKRITLSARKLFKSEICGHVGELLFSERTSSHSDSAGERKRISIATDGFVSEAMVDSLWANFYELMQTAYSAVHRTGLTVTAVAGTSGLVAQHVAPKQFPGWPISWHVAAMLAAFSALSFQIKMRWTGTLATPIGNKKRLVHLLGTNAFEREWEFGYLLMIVGFGAAGFWLQH